jgi:glycosyltransferase involved in cell wall biosynthesis
MVTIAIPFYNAENYLKEAIDSVLWQTYSDWKLILIDDGSNDNSLEIANKYKGVDATHRVRAAN